MSPEQIDAGPALNGETRTAVLLDRHPLWLEAVHRVLDRLQVTTVGKTTSPTDALRLIERHEPSLFVTGISMNEGEIDGLACVRLVRQGAPQVRPIVLSMHCDTAHVNEALAAGALAYVFKSAHPDDLASAVRQVFEHSIYFSGTRPAAPAPRATTLPNELTPREHEILRLVAEGYSNAQLAKMLWVTEQTIKFHLSNVYRKLNVANRTEAARWAQVYGLLEPTEAIA